MPCIPICLFQQNLVTDFMWVSYDGKNSADVYLSYSYFGRTCGLCGNFDGDKSNDLLLPSGEKVSD